MTLKNLFMWPTATKPKAEARQRQVVFHTQEIWWASLGPTVGVEVDGKRELYERPILVFRKFNSDTFWGLPLTSRIEEKSPFQFVFSLHSEQKSALISQMRVLSSKRLIRRLGKISDAQLRALNATIANFLHETDPLQASRISNRKPVISSVRPKRSK